MSDRDEDNDLYGGVILFIALVICITIASGLFGGAIGYRLGVAEAKATMVQSHQERTER